MHMKENFPSKFLLYSNFSIQMMGNIELTIGAHNLIIVKLLTRLINLNGRSTSPIFVPKQASVYTHSGYLNVMAYNPVIFRRFIAALFVLFLNTRARYGTLPYRFYSATKLNIFKNVP